MLSAEATGEGYGLIMTIVTIIALSKPPDLPLNTQYICATIHF